MNNLFKIILAVTACSICFTGCNNSQNNKENNQTTYQKNPAIAEKFKTTITRPEGTDVPVNSQAYEEAFPYINPLTGERIKTDLTAKRPLAIMINNIHFALPQVGISEADIVYEILEEGGITRLLCIYNNYENIPEIGSVRSARDYYIDIADAHDAIFVHAGGSTYAKNELAKRNTDNLDGLYLNTFYRSAERRKTMSSEHTLMISGQGLVKSIEDKKYRTTTDADCPLLFEDKVQQGIKRAHHIEIPFSIGNAQNPYAVSFFDYDTENRTYLKGQYDSPHIDGDDSAQLSFKNVISLICNMYQIPGDELGCIQVDFVGEGRGTYSVSGEIREIMWKRESRTSSYTLYEKDGTTPLVLSPGKTYIALVPEGTKLSVN